MSRLEAMVGIVVGVAQIVVIYIAFVAHEFVRASHSARALGIGVLFTTLGQPLFLLTAAGAFILAFYIVAR